MSPVIFPLLDAQGALLAILFLLAVGGLGGWWIRRRDAARRQCDATEMQKGQGRIAVPTDAGSKGRTGMERDVGASRSKVSAVPGGQSGALVAEPQTNALDLSLLRYLSDGTPPGLAEQVDRFVETLIKSEVRVSAAAGSGNISALGDAAHALLSQGRMVNHSGVIAAARQLEAATFAAQAGEIARLQAILLQEVEQLRALLAHCRPATLPR